MRALGPLDAPQPAYYAEAGLPMLTLNFDPAGDCGTVLWLLCALHHTITAMLLVKPDTRYFHVTSVLVVSHHRVSPAPNPTHVDVTCCFQITSMFIPGLQSVLPFTTACMVLVFIL